MPDSAVTCLNCGQPAGPRFCSFCGQAIDDRRAPLLSLLRQLTEEWLSIDGKRVPFLRPLRLYLLASVVLFSSVFTLRPPDATRVNLYVAGHLVTGAPAVRGRSTITILDTNSTTQRWISTTYADHFARLRARPPQEIVNALFNGLRRVLPVALIAFVPLLALALKVLYVRSHVLYVDHLIFGMHFQSALFFALAVTWIVLRVARAPFVVSVLTYLVVFLLMVTVYLSRALWRVYREARVTTWAKTALLLFAYLFAFQLVIGPAMLFVISQMQ